MGQSVVLRELGLCPYAEVLARMQAHTRTRGQGRGDEFWLVEHPPVYTLGQAGRMEYVHDPGLVPVVRTDRGGQVTYHGPGQAVLYTLLDLKARGLAVKDLVGGLESGVIDMLGCHGIEAERRPGAPGVYVEGRKIAQLGLRIRSGCSYHGVSLNVAVDLGPFRSIDPCGYPGLEVTRLLDLGVTLSVSAAGRELAGHCLRTLGLGEQEAGPP